MNEDRIPFELRQFKNWVLWRLEHRDGRLTKVPYSANYAGRASSTKPDTWSTFEKAREEYEAHPTQYNGIGFVISADTGLVFIDIDHCIATADDKDGRLPYTLNSAAVDILNLFPNQYAEFSQSGTGLHILTKGTIPKSFKNSQTGVEAYCEKRFCAMTGNALPPLKWVDKFTEIYTTSAFMFAKHPNNLRTISSSQDALDAVFQKYKPEEKTQPQSGHSVERASPSMCEADIIQKLVKHGSRVPLLYAGDWERAGYGSQSEADCALCTAIAFWCERDADTIDRIFRTSGLYRDKWANRSDYRAWTIGKASAACGETLSEYIERRDAEFEREFLSGW